MKKENQLQLTDFIRAGIVNSGLTKSEIAKRCGFASDNVINGIMSGAIPLPLELAERLAMAVGSDPDRLIMLVLRSIFDDDVIASIGRAICSLVPAP